MNKLLPWAAVLFWMMLLFSFSSQVAEESNQLSMGMTEIIVKIVENVVPEVDLDLKSFNNTLRKAVHFLAYLVLGILFCILLRGNGFHGLRCIMLAMVICVLFAVTDELHQLFVPGRGGQVRDVIIDCAGAGLGIGLYWAFFFRG